MRRALAFLCFALCSPGALVFAQTPPSAQIAPPTPGQRPRAILLLPARDGASISVSTPAWKDGGDIPFEHTMYRTNTFPGLSWTPGPAATQSYLVVMEDVGTARPEPVLHWTLFNIPPTLTRLEPGMTPTGNPPGSSYGPNISGQARPYLGPRTPPGPKHPYHFQVFALDRTLPADSINTFTTLLELAKGHVLASGELVGLGSADAK